MWGGGLKADRKFVSLLKRGGTLALDFLGVEMGGASLCKLENYSDP